MKKIVLNLSVTKEWYDLIVSGVKTEEYREIKPYWLQRLVDIEDSIKDNLRVKLPKVWNPANMDALVTIISKCLKLEILLFKPYTHILFINGYGANRPRIEKKIVSITIGKPKKGLCPDKWLDKEFFVIKFK